MGQEPTHEPTESELLELRNQVAKLQSALAELGGGVDAVVIDDVDEERIYTSASADRPYRVLVESMGEGAATVSEGGVILYANPTLATFLGVARDEMAGARPRRLRAVEDLPAVARLLALDGPGERREEVTVIEHRGHDGPVPGRGHRPRHRRRDGALPGAHRPDLQKEMERQTRQRCGPRPSASTWRARSTTPSSRGWSPPRWPSTSGEVDYARTVVARTSEHARHWIGELAGSDQLQPGMARAQRARRQRTARAVSAGTQHDRSSTTPRTSAS